MDNDNWLSDLASSLGLDISSHNHPHYETTPTPTIDHDSAIAPPIDHPHNIETHTQIHPEPHEWHQNIMWLHDRESEITVPTAPITHIEALGSHHHYDPNHHLHSSIIIGNPTEAMPHWHQQETAVSCGIVAQQSAIEQTTHQHFTEAQLRHDAQAHGWYNPNTGTPVEDFGKLLAYEAHVPVESHFGGTIAEIENKLAHHEQVFVGVNSQVEWLPDRESLLGQVAPNLFDPHHFAGQPANHIVQLIGVEVDSHTLQPTHVIVNDSSSVDGRGVEIPVEQFKVAMEASHNFVTSTSSQSEGTHLVGTHSHSESMTFGCDLSVYESNHTIYLNGSWVGKYTGNSFQNTDGVNVGTWSCESHHAYSRTGIDLGYAKTWRDAALLIYSRL